MQRLTAELVAADGVRLFRRAWLPETEVTGVVAVLHGYGEHGGRHENVAAALVPLGVAVHCQDLRGHGRSGGARGHVDRFARYLDDAALFLRAVAASHPDQPPLLLLGHSFGGLLAALYAEGLPPGADGGGHQAGESHLVIPRGVVLSSPFLALGEPVPRVKVAAARVLARLAPGRDIGNTLSAADLSHDEAVVAAYGADPLNHHVATARWAVETLAAQRRALDGAPRLRLPLLVLWGGQDRIALPAATRRLCERAGAADKTCREYPGFYHELFNESGKEAPLGDLAAWVRARVAQPVRA